jgi:glycosyltransferase involved in cell wall biosynthesis
VLSQTYDDFELLVVDDASSDHTCAVVERYPDPRVRLERNPRNLGNARNRSRAIQLARSELIKFVDQDDWLEPSCVEEHVRCMESNPTVGLTFSRRALALEDKPSAEAQEWAAWHERLVPPELNEFNRGSDLLDRLVEDGFHENWIGEPTSVMLRRSYLRHSGLFNRQLRLVLDRDLWTRVMAFCDVGYLDRELATRWVSSDSDTISVRATRRHWLDRLWLLQGFRELPALWERRPDELATTLHNELKSALVSTVTGRYRTTRLMDALRDLGHYGVHRVNPRASLFDWLDDDP